MTSETSELKLSWYSNTTLRKFFFSTISYTLLTLGSIAMLFPLFWMFTASLKPEWQILRKPPIWIPSEWIHVQAGTTPYEIPLWQAKDAEDEAEDLIKMGVRRFTTVIDGNAIPDLFAAPTDQLSDAVATNFGDVVLNVREWRHDGTTEDVVALARGEDDTLIVASVSELQAVAARMPLDEVNAGGRERFELNETRFQGRLLDDGQLVVPLGPESELIVVSPKSVAEVAILAPVDAPINIEQQPLGSTLVEVFNLPDQPEDQLFVRLTTESWQPIISLDTVRNYGFTVQIDELSEEREIGVFNSVEMPVATVALEDGEGEESQEVVVLVEDSDSAFVIPVEHTDTLRLTPLGKLALPFVATIDGSSVRYRNDYEELGERHEIAIVSERRDMSLVVPIQAVSSAFDIPTNDLKAVLVPHLTFQNYKDALSRDLGDATFFTFYRNSAILVVLNLIGHFFSVTLVAYAFARLRAPGKNFLFMLLLSTMMLPFPVLLIPTFEIFQEFGMINTLWPLFIRSFFGNAFLIFLLRQFFMSIPLDLEDAARIDGANTMQVLWSVILPLSKPALATIAIFTFWWTWNSFFEPFVYLSSVKNFTVSLGLGFFQGQYNTSYHLLMAASMVAILPIILIFFAAQRYFIEGIQLTGLKG